MNHAITPAPLIVGIGSSGRAGSNIDHALRVCLKEAERSGARTQIFATPELTALPLLDPYQHVRSLGQQALVRAVRASDGVVIATPSYHGGISGLVKNAIDLLEDLRQDVRPYLSGRAVGCIVASGGAQASGITLVSMRSTVHALRGWPTPLGVALQGGGDASFNDQGECLDATLLQSLKIMTAEVLFMAFLSKCSPASAPAVV